MSFKNFIKSLAKADAAKGFAAYKYLTTSKNKVLDTPGFISRNNSVSSNQTFTTPQGQEYKTIATDTTADVNAGVQVGPNYYLAPCRRVRIRTLDSSGGCLLLLSHSGTTFFVFQSSDSNLYSIDVSVGTTGIPTSPFSGYLLGFSNDGQHLFVAGTTGVVAGNFKLYWCVYKNFQLNKVGSSFVVQSADVIKGSYSLLKAGFPTAPNPPPVENNPFSGTGGIAHLVAQSTTFAISNPTLDTASGRGSFPGTWISFNLTTDKNGVLRLDFASHGSASTTATTQFEVYDLSTPQGIFLTEINANTIDFRLAITDLTNTPSVSSIADWTTFSYTTWVGPNGPSYQNTGGSSGIISGTQALIRGQPFRNTANQLSSAWEGNSDGIQYWDHSGIVTGVSPAPNSSALVAVTDQFLVVATGNPFNTSKVRPVNSGSFLSINTTVGQQEVVPYSQGVSGFVAGPSISFDFPSISSYKVLDWIA